MTENIILVTGGCGFIGSCFVRKVLSERPAWRVINVDALTYAGNLANLSDFDKDPRYTFVRGDITDGALVETLAERCGDKIDAIVNFAAESHVDRSVVGPGAFVRTNITGTFNLLQLARRLPGVRYIQVSTDEVYGSLGETGYFTEETPLDPSSPYSASKAAADLLVNSYVRTFGVDAVITRCSNNYGPFQFPEKLIPLMILNARSGKELPVYGRGTNIRDWIHVDDHCNGILLALDRGKTGEVYNFGGESERANVDIVHFIADRVAGSRDLVRFVKDRPGHDFRYAMDITKSRQELGFEPKMSFEAGLESTINWYLTHQDWWTPILSGEYLRFYEQWYGER